MGDILEISILSQVLVFLFSIVLGLIFGVIFDFFRIIDTISNTSLKKLFFEDILYFFIMSILTFIFMLIFNKGDFRIFIVIGELIGFFLWHFTLGKINVRFFSNILIFLKSKFLFIVNKLLLPFTKLYNKIKFVPRNMWYKLNLGKKNI